MSLDELIELIHAVDKKHGGCLVEFTTHNVPAQSKGQMFGIVTWGLKDYQRSFHTTEELRGIMGRLSK